MQFVCPQPLLCLAASRAEEGLLLLPPPPPWEGGARECGVRASIDRRLVSLPPPPVARASRLARCRDMRRRWQRKCGVAAAAGAKEQKPKSNNK